MPSTHTVTSADGVRLAVRDDENEGDAPGRPVLVAIHGYPDDQSIWAGLRAELAPAFRVVSYDVRGAGASDHPAARSAYRMPHLVADIEAVLDAVSPDAPVHLLGHDWGSVQAWAAVSEPRLATRIASFTSISGPDLDQSAVWTRRLRRQPRAVLRQLRASYYTVLFQLPWLPEAAWRSGRLDPLLARHGGGDRIRAEADKINGLRLYRANMFAHLGRPRPRPTAIPVLVIAPRRDPFITVALQTEAPIGQVADLRVREVDGGHWLIADDPALVAGLIADFVESAGQSPTARSSAERSSSK